MPTPQQTMPTPRKRAPSATPRPRLEGIYSRLLHGWTAAVKAGHCLTPARFIVLCDILQHPTQAISSHTRAKRLHFAQPTVIQAQRHLATLGLVTLSKIPLNHPHRNLRHHSNPILTATPTPAAYHLFNLKGPYNRKPV